MKRRIFHVYFVPTGGGVEREYQVRAINYAEAEALAAKWINPGEFICRIEQEFS